MGALSGLKGNRQRQPHLRLPGGNLRAAQAETGRGVLQCQADRPVESIAPQGMHSDRHRGTSPGVDARRHDAEIEIGPRRADPQAVGIFRAALVLGVIKMQIIGAGRRQHGPQPTIGMMREQAARLVLVVVVEGQLPAGGVGQLEHGIQGRIEPAGVDFGHDLLPGLPSKRKTSRSPA